MIVTDRHNTIGTDDIVSYGFVSYILKTIGNGRNQQYPFLEESQPQIAETVFHNGMNF